jgi:hypothetical protein
MVSYPTICEIGCAIKANRRWGLRWGVIPVPNHVGGIAHPHPYIKVRMANSHVPMYWVGDTITRVREGLPWAPMARRTPIAVVGVERARIQRSRTGLGLGGNSGQADTGHREATR